MAGEKKRGPTPSGVTGSLGGAQGGGAWEDPPALSLLLPPPHPPLAPDIRLDWETYAPEAKEDQLLELLVFYGPPFPLRDQDGNEVLCPETPESSSSSQTPSVSNESSESSSSPEVAHSVSKVARGRGRGASGPGA